MGSGAAFVARGTVVAVLLGLLPSIVGGQLAEPAGAQPPAATQQEPDPAPITRELLPELSTSTTDTFIEPDGSLTLEAAAAPVNYRDGDGAWTPIDTELIEAPGDRWAVESAATSYDLSLPEEASQDPVRFARGDWWIAMSLDGATGEPAVDGSTATYEVAGAAADSLEYQAEPTGLKETIVIDEAPSEPAVFEFDLKVGPGLSPVETSSGAIDFVNPSGKSVFVVPAGWMEDSAPEPAVSGEVAYELSEIDQTSGSWRLRVIPDGAWLADPDREFPVRVDPTVQLNRTVSCWLEENAPTVSRCSAQYMKVGQDSPTQRKRAVLQFDLSSIPADKMIGTANLQLHVDSDQTTGTTSGQATFAVYSAGKTFNNTATWNSSGPNGSWVGGDPGTTAYGAVPSNWAVSGLTKFDVKALVEAYRTDPTSNHGYVVKQTTGTPNATIAFAGVSSLNPTTQWPKLVVNYGAPPSAPTTSITPCLDACTTWKTDTATPSFTASSSDADSTDLTYTYRLRKTGTTSILVSSPGNQVGPKPQGTPASWLVPVGAITASGQYQMQVSVTDASQITTTGPWKGFTVDLGAAGSSPTTINSSTNITTDVAWTRANSPYLVSAGVDIKAGGSLTMEPGTVVKFSGLGGRIIVHQGRLTAVGTLNRPIVWTSINDDTVMGHSSGSTGTAQRGDYGNAVSFDGPGINETGISEGEIKNVSQRYGGAAFQPCGGSGEGLRISGDSRVRVSRSEFMHNASFGLAVVSDEPDAVVRTSRFSENGCGLMTNGAGDLYDNVFDLNTIASVKVLSAVGQQVIEGNWMYDGLEINGSSHREQLDVHGNTILNRLSTIGNVHPEQASDLEHNWWGYPLVLPSGCYPRGGLDTHFPPVEINAALCGDNNNGEVAVGYNDNLLPSNAGPPPFPEAGLEANPASQDQIEALLGSSGEFGNRGDGEQADPVNSRTGNYVDHVTDAALPAPGLPVIVTRTYNSLDDTAGALGRGWSISYQERLIIESATSVVFVSSEGQRIRYTKTAGAWRAAAKSITAVLTEDSVGFTLTTRAQLKYRFDLTGVLLRVRDRNLQTVSVTRNTAGQIIKIANGTRAINLAYTTTGKIESLTLPGGATITYSYANGLLTSVTDAEGRETTYDYHPDGRLKWEKNPAGTKVMELTYNPSTGRVAEQVDANGGHTTFAWNPATETSTMTDPGGGKWTDDYQESVLARRVDPLGNAWSYFYDAKLQLRSTRDPRGVETKLTYDSSGDITASIGPFGRVETTYNQLHDPERTTNAKGIVTDFTYDTAGNLTSVVRTRPSGETLTDTFVVDTRGLVTGATDARGKTTTFEYNSTGDLTKVTDPAGRVTTVAYTSTGQVASIVDPPGNLTGADPLLYKTELTYNDADQPLTSTHPILGTTTVTYDTIGRLWKMVDAKNRTTTLSYDNASHLVSVQGPDASGPTSTATYNANGDLASTTDTRDRTISYGYDLAGRATSTTSPFGNYIYGYDQVGNMVSAKRSGNAEVKFTYNDQAQITGIDYASSPATDIAYAYDQHGNRTSMIDGAGTTTYTFDDLDRLTRVDRTAGPTFTYGYDQVGNITSSTGPSGNLTYAYTVDNQLDTVTTTPTGGGASELVDYTYGTFGLPIRADMANGTMWERAYDRAGRVTRITHKRANADVILSETYTLDKSGFPTKILRDDGTTSRTDTLTYDALDHLTGICYDTTTCTGATDYVQWAYDSEGNRTSETRPSPAGEIQYTYAYHSATGRLESSSNPAGVATYTYDGYGRNTGQTVTPTGGTPTTTTFVYNEANQLRTSTTNSQVTTYTYDGDGRRLTTKVPSGATTRFNWDPRSYLLASQATTPAGGGAADGRAYQYGLGPISYTGGDPNTSAATYQYTHTDYQGSFRAITDASGSIDRRRDWEPYGVATTQQTPDPSSLTPGLGWAGEAENPDGTTHLRARNYDPVIGRFTMPDPASSTSPSATYTYANSNPMAYADPSGLSTISNIWNGLTSIAPTIASIAGLGMLAAPVAPFYGPLAFFAGAVTAIDSAATAYQSCSTEKGTCGNDVLSASLDAAAALPFGRLIGSADDAGRLTMNACRANSFTGTTLVLMADGSKKRIKDVALGDKVAATDPETGETGPRKVVDLIRHRGLHTMVSVRISKELTIEATDHHPFWVETRGKWVDAIDLRVGDVLITADNDLVAVVGLDRSEQRVRAYNLTVEGLHTYHVGNEEVLVHNCAALASMTAQIKKAGLTHTGKIRFVPPKGDNLLLRGPNNGYIDRFGNEWRKGPPRTPGDPYEWDVIPGLHAPTWFKDLAKNGTHVNVSLGGAITH